MERHECVRARNKVPGAANWRSRSVMVAVVVLASLGAVPMAAAGQPTALTGDPVSTLMAHVPSLLGCTPNPGLDLGGAGTAFGYEATAEVDCQLEGLPGVSLAVYMLYPSSAIMNAAFHHVWVNEMARPGKSLRCSASSFVTGICKYWTGRSKVAAGQFVRFFYTQAGTPEDVPAIAWTSDRLGITAYLSGAEHNDGGAVLKYWESGSANPVGTRAQQSNGGSRGASVQNAQLTGLFSVTLTVDLPRRYRGQRFSVSWSFTPSCGSGPCSVQVDTAANACPSGQCAQPPSAVDFAGEPLAYSKGRYRGSFVITTACRLRTGNWPYAYNQRTQLSLTPTEARKVGTIGNEPLDRVSAIGGTVTISGSPNQTGREQGCAPYADTLSVRGTSQP